MGCNNFCNYYEHELKDKFDTHDIDISLFKKGFIQNKVNMSRNKENENIKDMKGAKSTSYQKSNFFNLLKDSENKEIEKGQIILAKKNFEKQLEQHEKNLKEKENELNNKIKKQEIIINNLNEEKNKLNGEKNRLNEEKNRLNEEKNKLNEEKNKLDEEKNKLNEEKKKLNEEKNKNKLLMEEYKNKLKNVNEEKEKNKKQSEENLNKKEEIEKYRQNLEKQLKEKDNNLKKEEKRINQKQIEIAKKEKEIDDKSKKLEILYKIQYEEKEKKLNENNKIYIQEKELHYKERENKLKEKENLLKQQEQEIINKKEQLNQKEQEMNKKLEEAELLKSKYEKEQKELNKKNEKFIQDKEKYFSQREKDLKEKEKSFEKKEIKINDRNNQLNIKEEEINTKAKEINLLKESIHKEQKKLKEANEKYNEEKKIIITKELELSEKEKSIVEMEKALILKKNKLSKIEEKNANNENQVKNKNLELKSQIKQYEKQIQQQKEEIISLKQLIQKLKDELEKLKTTIIIGLNNIGATCYMNATLQCLSNSGQLTEYFLKNYYPNPNRIMSNEYHKVLINLWDIKNNNKSYSPNSFKEVLSKENPLFAGIAANDSKDLINFLLERFHQELNVIKPNINNINNINNSGMMDQTNENLMLKVFLEEYTEKFNSPISNLFYGILETKSQCLGCNVIKFNFQVYSFLEFPLQQVNQYFFNNGKRPLFTNEGKNPDVDLYECFEYNAKVDLMSGENQMYCNICNKLLNSYYSTIIYSSPIYLIINLNRGKGAVYECKVNFPEQLNLYNFVTFKSGFTAYGLYAVICHLGPSSMSGHFVAYCRNRMDNKWYLYNDGFVTKCSKPFQYNDGMPYILFYKALTLD